MMSKVEKEELLVKFTRLPKEHQMVFIRWLQNQTRPNSQQVTSVNIHNEITSMNSAQLQLLAMVIAVVKTLGDPDTPEWEAEAKRLVQALRPKARKERTC